MWLLFVVVILLPDPTMRTVTFGPFSTETICQAERSRRVALYDFPEAIIVAVCERT